MSDKRQMHRYLKPIPIKYQDEVIEEWASRGWSVTVSTSNTIPGEVLLTCTKDPTWQAPKWDTAARKRLRQWVCLPEWQKRIRIKAINLAGSGGQVTGAMVLQAFHEMNQLARENRLY